MLGSLSQGGKDEATVYCDEKADADVYTGLRLCVVVVVFFLSFFLPSFLSLFGVSMDCKNAEQ